MKKRYNIDPLTDQNGRFYFLYHLEQRFHHFVLFRVPDLVTFEVAFRPIFNQQSIDIHHPNIVARLLSAATVHFHRFHAKIGYPDSCLDRATKRISETMIWKRRGGVGKIVTYDTSPAPKNTNLFSDILFLVILFDARIPATATAAVPCISSLNVQYLSRYLSKKRKAL